MGRPKQSLLTKARIVEVATALIDAEGLEQFSTRRLAAELGVRGPSLYNHFANKAEILDAVADSITGQVDISFFTRDDWRVALKLWAQSYRKALAAHPNIVPYITLGPGRRPSALGIANAVYGGLTQAGWPPAKATHIGALMRFFVVGSSAGSFAAGFDQDRQIYAAHYPHLSQAHRLAEHAARVDEQAFMLGLESLINGLASHYEQIIGPLPPLT